MMMIVPAKCIMKIQELVELEDLKKTYIKSRFIVLLWKVDFEKKLQSYSQFCKITSVDVRH